jgi:hypothetical protein
MYDHAAPAQIPDTVTTTTTPVADDAEITAALATLDNLRRRLEARLRPVRLKSVPMPTPAPLPERIEQVLRERTASLAELARAVDAPPAEVTAALRPIGQSVANVGTAIEARYTWIIGDATRNDVLYPLVERLLRERPMTTPELVAATGARFGRCSGAVVHLQTHSRVFNLGQANKGRWIVIPPDVRPVRLKPRK